MNPSSSLTGARARLRRWVTVETTGGALLLAAAVLGLAWANSPWRHAYRDLVATTAGPSALHLDLSLAAWASDGLLAVFFLVVGAELKHELVAGSLRRPRQAAVPVLAALGGMIVPAVLFSVVVTIAGDPGALHGWAIPTATDIAFALAVLAVFGRGLPRALRVFLLTLAVVDDLLAIIVIALFYTSGLQAPTAAGALGVVALIGLLARLRRPRWWLIAPLALVAWGLMHASGVHATIAGVLVGLSLPARPLHGEPSSRARRAEQALRPFSSAVALPVFAFVAAGVPLGGEGGAAAILGQPVVAAVAAGLLVGKAAGVLGATALVTRLSPLRLPDGIGLRDLVPIGLLTGVGFTVSLLIAELSFEDAVHTEGARLAVLLSSVAAGAAAAVAFRWDARRARSRDMNEDGIPDRDTALIRDARDV